MAVAKKTSKDDNELCYCRKCRNFKKPDQFYETTNPALDSNGKLSVCKSCCGDIYDEHFKTHNDIEKSLRASCEDLDVCFNYDAFQQTVSHIEKLRESGKKAGVVFGYYKSKLSSTAGKNAGMSFFRYRDSDFDLYIEEDEDVDEDWTVFLGRRIFF